MFAFIQVTYSNLVAQILSPRSSILVSMWPAAARLFLLLFVFVDLRLDLFSLFRVGLGLQPFL